MAFPPLCAVRREISPHKKQPARFLWPDCLFREVYGAFYRVEACRPLISANWSQQNRVFPALPGRERFGPDCFYEVAAGAHERRASPFDAIGNGLENAPFPPRE